MRGHTELLAMRRCGAIPVAVVVKAFKGLPPLGFDGSTVDIEIPPGESLGRLDLRFLVGLPVFVGPGSSDDGWARRVAQACANAGARVFIDGDKLEQVNGSIPA